MTSSSFTKQSSRRSRPPSQQENKSNSFSLSSNSKHSKSQKSKKISSLQKKLRNIKKFYISIKMKLHQWRELRNLSNFTVKTT